MKHMTIERLESSTRPLSKSSGLASLPTHLCVVWSPLRLFLLKWVRGAMTLMQIQVQGFPFKLDCKENGRKNQIKQRVTRKEEEKTREEKRRRGIQVRDESIVFIGSNIPSLSWDDNIQRTSFISSSYDCYHVDSQLRYQPPPDFQSHVFPAKDTTGNYDEHCIPLTKSIQIPLRHKHWGQLQQNP